MEKADKIIEALSAERFTPYLRHCGGDTAKALELYRWNIEISQSFYAPLALLEITLRNKIDQIFRTHFGHRDWLTQDLPPKLLKPVVEIEIKLTRAKKDPTNSAVLAELNFGFWTTLFNRQYAKLFWKPLHRAFRHLPSHQRRRTEVSSRLNHIRTFRNRIYHYEPICWNAEALRKKAREIEELTTWLNPEVERWAKPFRQFENTMKRKPV